MLNVKMKKIIFILISLLCLCSCVHDYKCVVKYEISYPDTTWVNVYEFDGCEEAFTQVFSATNYKTLYVYPNGHVSVGMHDIATIPKGDSNITILDYKMYKYGIDIPKKKSNEERRF